MLHLVRPSENRKYLKRILALQARLLKAVCQPNVTADTITEEWVKQQLRPLKSRVTWVKLFTGVPLQRELKIIAQEPEKDKIWSAFVHDIRVYTCFTSTATVPFPMQWPTVKSELLEETREAVKAYFLLFYDPHLYVGSGYKIALTPGTSVLFDRAAFLANTDKTNPNLLACPFCDSGMDGVRVDHFFPKAEFPFFSCHPWNLVKVCSTCNDFENKKEKVPLTLAATQPVEDWFHPYLRPLADWTTLDGHPDATTFDIKFEKVANVNTPIMVSSDTTIQRRLNNLNDLVNISTRWRDQFIPIYRDRLKDIKNYKRRYGSLTPDEVQTLLQEWAEDKQSSISQRGFSMLEYAFLRMATNISSSFFQEFLVEASDADPLTVNRNNKLL